MMREVSNAAEDELLYVGDRPCSDGRCTNQATAGSPFCEDCIGDDRETLQAHVRDLRRVLAEVAASGRSLVQFAHHRHGTRCGDTCRCGYTKALARWKEITAGLLRPPSTELTGPQSRELLELDRRPQATFGHSRTKVQNKLVRLGLARFDRDVGGDWCRITDEGRKRATIERTRRR